MKREKSPERVQQAKRTKEVKREKSPERAQQAKRTKVDKAREGALLEKANELASEWERVPFKGKENFFTKSQQKVTGLKIKTALDQARDIGLDKAIKTEGRNLKINVLCVGSCAYAGRFSSKIRGKIHLK